jgi:hypothetical protein
MGLAIDDNILVGQSGESKTRNCDSESCQGFVKVKADSLNRLGEPGLAS